MNSHEYIASITSNSLRLNTVDLIRQGYNVIFTAHPPPSAGQGHWRVLCLIADIGPFDIFLSLLGGMDKEWRLHLVELTMDTLHSRIEDSQGSHVLMIPLDAPAPRPCPPQRALEVCPLIVNFKSKVVHVCSHLSWSSY